MIVIGAGQAGLALGHYLKQHGLRFVIVDSASHVGSSWRSRWDSLRLFTPSQYDALPGFPFPGPAGTYPSKDDVADYLDHYARRFELPVRTSSRVTSVVREGPGYQVRTEDATYHADQVVVATGPFHRPALPAFSGRLSADVFQLHSSAYQRPEAIPAGDVLVVGAGNSGTQIAVELAASRKVYLARGRTMPVLPELVLGRSLFWWLKNLGVMRVSADSAFGRRMQGNDDVVIGTSTAKLVHSGRIEVLPRVVQAEGNVIAFADGRSLVVASVIWATGFVSDYGWLEVPVLDDSGAPAHRRGVTASPGLYFLGLRWQHTPGSALLGWVKNDARYIAEQIRLNRRTGQS